MLIIRNFGVTNYLEIWQQMQHFTSNRTPATDDEIWLVEHFAVFTQGKAGDAKHILNKTNIPIVQSDRGGQITFHAPGQQIMYVLLDLKRLKSQGKVSTVRGVVSALEESVIQTLKHLQITSYAKKDAPGVYVDERKICSLGLKVTNNCTLHGLALNIDMDLSPFLNINPCGYSNLEMTQIKDLIAPCPSKAEIAKHLAKNFVKIIGYESHEVQFDL